MANISGRNRRVLSTRTVSDPRIESWRKLGITFLQKNQLKLICTKEKGTLMPVKDGSNSRARLVDGGCVSFENRRSRKICKANKGQEIAVQTWRIPREKRNINVLQDGVEENIGVYAKEKCSIPAGMGKYVPVQTNRAITVSCDSLHIFTTLLRLLT